MKKGGIVWPQADTAAQTVISSPRSADTKDPTYFEPCSATTFGGLVTVVTQVSSQFQIHFASNVYLSSTFPRRLKNLPTFTLLNAVARPMLVDSGVRNEISGCLFIKCENQSGPACCLTDHEGGHLTLNHSAH